MTRPQQSTTIRKPRILLIPNVAWWIIGEMGKQIIARFGDKYDFYFFPEPLLARRPELLRSMVPAVDAIHCLNESALELFLPFKPDELPPIATWIHHVTSWSPWHQSAIDRSAAITVCTAGWKDYLEQRVPANLPITIVPHGIDLELFHKIPVDRSRFGVPPGRFVLGFIGAKSSNADGGRKGTDVLFKVVREAATLIPNLHVVLAGPGWEDEVTALAGLNISASSTGYIRKADLPALYSALDVYLLTSRVEGGPCTVFESMACETPVVSTRVGAVPELILDGINGYSAEVDDSAALVAAIVQLAQSPQHRASIGIAGEERVSSLPWGRALNPLEAVYDDLISLDRKKSPLPGPPWMHDPQQLLRATCAADALVNVLPQLRARSISPTKGLRLLHEMLHQQTLTDIARGARIAWGPAVKTGPA